MADRTIKPDDTNDLVLQNNDGSAKLELNEDQTVKVTTGSDAGEDFTVNSTQLVVEGDSGNVGIGASSGLLGKLHIQEFGSVAGSVSSGADSLVLQNNGGHGGLSVVTNNTSTASLHLGDTDSSTRGGLQYDNNADTLSVLSGGSVRATIDSSGNATLNSGNLVIGTAGKGITFGGDPDSRNSGVTAGDRTLYDYEEGSFSAVLTDGSNTQSFQDAKYTKIGNVVNITCQLADGGTTVNLGTWGSGSAQITGLPFTANSTCNVAETLYYFDFGGNAGEEPYLLIQEGTSNVQIRKSNGDTANNSAIGTDIDGDQQIRFGMTYFV